MDQAYNEIGIITDYLNDERISCMSSGEKALFNFMYYVHFDEDFAETLKSNCKRIFQTLLNEALKYKKVRDKIVGVEG